jgi:type IV secretory pathway VirB9-like protein
MRKCPVTLVVCLLLLGGCQQGPPPEPAVAPPPEDLSHWTVPELVQPDVQKRVPLPMKAARKATEAEQVYAYVPGGVYKVTVALTAPLDIILEPGEKVETLMGTDPKPIVPTPEQQQLKNRFEYKEGSHGVGDKANAHVLLRALEARATLGLTITTSRRVYYLDCQSVQKSPIRAVWWKYPPSSDEEPVHESKAPSLLPDPREPKLYHVGYELSAPRTAPAWMPRYVVDDGKKFYIVYPEVTLFGTVPLVRAIGPNGPQVVNSRQVLNVVILDLLPPKIELRVGTGEGAQVVTITRGNLRTMTCPGDEACPVWPAAAQRLAGRQS